MNSLEQTATKLAEELWDITPEQIVHRADFVKESKPIIIRHLSRQNKWLNDLPSLLCDVAQLLDGWHNDGTSWSEWDESVRKRVTELQMTIERNTLLKTKP